MDRDRFRSQFAEHFYRSLEESGVKFEGLSPAQLQALSRAMADGVFGVLEAVDTEAPAPTQAEEHLLWSGKPYMSLGTRYELTSQRLRIMEGLFSRTVEEIDLVRVRDTKVTQTLGERALGVGDVLVVTSDPTNPEITLRNVRDAMEVRETLRKAYLAEQKRRGLKYREED